MPEKYKPKPRAQLFLPFGKREKRQNIGAEIRSLNVAIAEIDAKALQTEAEHKQRRIMQKRLEALQARIKTIKRRMP